MGMRRALVLHPSARGPRWLAFRDPQAVHRAETLDQVPSVLAAAEAAAGDGRWVVLVVAYDGAPALEPAMVARRHPTAPLAVAGVFARAEPAAGPRPAPYRVGSWRPSLDEEAHAAAVRRARGHIAAGDVYQINLTLRLRASFDGDPEGLFTSLFRAQAPAHAAYVELDEGVVCSASPELFLARRGSRLTTRPMKGTAARAAGATADQDRAVAAALATSPKERAENTMIVDVARNDLGRVARVGSVVVDQLHTVEHYPTVHQLTSSVRADTDAGLVQVMSAMFPAASITGAPKVRATRLIDELEGSARGVYCGTVGVLGPDGWHLNVAIRTAWVEPASGSVEYGAGGGIVWDSEPAAEWAEVGAKAAILRGGRPSYRLLETMRWEPGAGIRAVDRHRDRLLDSAAFLGFGVDRDRLDAALAPFAPAGGGAGAAGGEGCPARVRLLVDADGGCEVEVGEAPRWGSFEEPSAPWRAVLADRPVRADDLFCRHKTTHRVAYEQARLAALRAAGHGAVIDEVICWDEQGRLTETTIGNLVLEVDGRLMTPAAGAGLLPGTARAALLADGVVVEGDLAVADLARASGVWSVNAVRGWVRLDVVERG